MNTSNNSSNKTNKFISPGNIEAKLLRKRNLYLALIRKHPGIFRQECAKRMQISTFNSTRLATSLLHEKMIIEQVPDLTGKIPRGRPTLPLYINPEYQYFAGIDFEANRWRFTIINFSGNMIFSTIMPFTECDNRKAYIEQLCNLLTSAIMSSGDLWHNVVALGIAAPGFLDKQNGVIQNYEILPHFLDIPLCDIYHKISLKPVFIVNNVITLAIYDNWKQPEVAEEIILYVAIRSGISAVLNINGTIYHGSQGNSGELGLTLLPCGQFLQDIAGLKALQQTLTEADDKFWHGQTDVVEQTYLNHQTLLDEVLDTLAITLGSNAAMLAPDRIVIYSELFPEENILWRKLNKKLKVLRKKQNLPKIAVVRACNAELNEAIGVALLALESIYNV